MHTLGRDASSKEEFIKIHYQYADRLCFLFCPLCCSFFFKLPISHNFGYREKREQSRELRQIWRNIKTTRTKTKKETSNNFRFSYHQPLLSFKNGSFTRDQIKLVDRQPASEVGATRNYIKFEYITNQFLRFGLLICIKVWSRSTKSALDVDFSSVHKLNGQWPSLYRSIIIAKREINFLIVNIKRTKMCRRST